MREFRSRAYRKREVELNGTRVPAYHSIVLRQVSGLVVMAAVVDLLVSTKKFCMPKSGLTYPYICLVFSHTANFCSPISHTNHISPTLGVIC